VAEPPKVNNHLPSEALGSLETGESQIVREQTENTWLRASSCEKLREVGCNDAEIGSITGMSPAMIRRYLRFSIRSALQRLRSGG
jgi:hypothetical protein